MPQENTHSPVYFLGAGLHSCLGRAVDENLQSLKQLPCAPAQLRNETTDENLYIPYKLLVGSPLKELKNRLYHVVDDVIEQAFNEANLPASTRRNMGLYLGSSSFDIGVTEAIFQQELLGEGLGDEQTALPMRDPSIANLADYIVESTQLKGADYSFNTACTSSANALLTATAHIKAGIVDYALVVGVELYNDITALGFHSLGLLTHSAMQPFGDDRDGLILGEGVSALVIGRVDTDEVPNKKRFYLRGGATFSDSHSMTASNPDGATVAKVINQALVDAAVDPCDVTALKVHGTASLSNDEAEAAGMHKVFTRLPYLCALKPYIGHTLGGCGLNELILFYRALEAGFLIANPNSVSGELGIQLNQTLTPSELMSEQGVVSGNFMLNYFGFGGNNTSLLISNL